MYTQLFYKYTYSNQYIKLRINYILAQFKYFELHLVPTHITYIFILFYYYLTNLHFSQIKLNEHIKNKT